MLTKKIHADEVGLYFHDGEFRGLLDAGRHWFFDPLGKIRIEIVSQRKPQFFHEQLDVIVKSGVLKDRAVAVDLKDRQRGIVWIDGRFSHLLSPGQYVYWTAFHDVNIQVVEVDLRDVRFRHPDEQVIVRSAAASRDLDVLAVEPGHAGVLFQDGNYVETLSPGVYMFWKNTAKIQLFPLDLRETMLDVGGQEIMTADKVTLRLNAMVAFRITDAHKAVSSTGDARQSLYREAQSALRAVIGSRELDPLLTDKDAVSEELESELRRRTTSLGMELVSFGIRDVILPGDMKDLMNKVTEAKKSAEAELIARREETAAVRSRLNTAKLLESSPTLMRLRELETLEKVAASGKLQVLVGEKGLTERVVHLL